MFGQTHVGAALGASVPTIPRVEARETHVELGGDVVHVNERAAGRRKGEGGKRGRRQVRLGAALHPHLAGAREGRERAAAPEPLGRHERLQRRRRGRRGRCRGRGGLLRDEFLLLLRVLGHPHGAVDAAEARVAVAGADAADAVAAAAVEARLRDGGARWVVERGPGESGDGENPLTKSHCLCSSKHAGQDCDVTGKAAGGATLRVSALASSRRLHGQASGLDMQWKSVLRVWFGSRGKSTHAN